MLFAAASAVAALSSVVGVSAGPLQSREVGGILICTGANATGDCDYRVYEMKKCNQLPEPYHRNVGTFAPDGENFFCFPHTYDCDGGCRSPTGCTIGAVNFTWPYKYDVAAVGWNDLFMSFDCNVYRDPSGQ